MDQMTTLYGTVWCSDCKRTKKFFAEPAHRVDGTEPNLSKVSQQISDCLSLREREGKAVASYLKAMAP